MKSSKRDLVVYTAIENSYDSLKPIPGNISDVEFICFSNTMIPGRRRGWTIVKNPCDHPDPTTRCRYVKSNPHLVLQDFSASLWIDGSISMTREFKNFLLSLEHSEVNLSVISHPLRNCIYEEGETCVRAGKENPRNWQILKSFLETESYPVNFGLIESCVLFRRHLNEDVIKVMDLWWSMISDYSRRDQLSFNYAAWLLGTPLSFLNGSARGDNPAFFFAPHRVGDARNFFHHIFYTLEEYLAILPKSSGLVKILRNLRSLFYSVARSVGCIK